MAFYDPVTWVPYLPWLLVAYFVWDAWGSTYSMRQNDQIIVPSMLIGAVYLMAKNWTIFKLGYIVPEPYLDEVFHIPQAQAYCQGDFHIWDPKLTTPPGLYAFTTIYANLAGIRNCDVDTLRSFNNLALLFATVYAGSCYASIAKLSGLKNPMVLHNMFNIALFPPLFFFSGLFYTDVLSTAIVLKMYRDFLRERSGISLYLTGTVALTMRQTNIFWTAVFLSGLEVVRALKSIELKKDEREAPEFFKNIVGAAFYQYKRGEVHDISLKDAEVEDYYLCALSIGIAVIFHPLLILRKIWPYIAILLSFAYFVFWNGGVVLGDKQNHVATLHLPQLLYLWPFLTFFSLPFLIPSILLFLRSLITLQLPTSQSVILFGRKINRSLYVCMHFCNTLLITCVIIKCNTIIHPFTLADNRHYMFYIFRYTILRHPFVKYLLGPIYILCFYLCYTTLSTSSFPLAKTNLATIPAGKPTLARGQRRRKLRSVKTGEVATTSFFLMYIITTALSLITAPLVEPRYFILPFIIFRLHVPSLSFPAAGSSARKPKTSSLPKKWAELEKNVVFYAWEGHDPRLWIESAWFAAINVITMWVFLSKGFEWKQEPGMVQRFMW